MDENLKDLIIQNIPTLADDEETLGKLVTTVKNTIEQERQVAFKEAQSKAYSYIDETLKNLGIEKPENVKTSEFIGQILTEKNSKLKELEEKLKNAKTPGEVKDYIQQIDALKETLKEKENEFLSEKQKIENQYKAELTKFAIASQFPNIETDLPPETFNILKQRAIEDLMKSASYEDGQIKFRDERGNILLNKKNQNNPYTVKDMLAELDYMKPILNKKPTTPPLGGKGGQGGMPDKTEFFKEMREKGYSDRQIFEEWKKLNKK